MDPVPPPKRHPYAQWSPDSRALDLVGDKWTLLIIRDLASGPRRFVELQRVLPGISTEQLRSRLNRMVADDLVSRSRHREVPPRVEYALTECARELLPVIGALARWGYAWTWTEPRRGERVDVGAIFRLAPGLLDPGVEGRVELVVGAEGPRRPERTYELAVLDGDVAVTERPAEGADARVAGDVGDWVEALRPGGDLGALRITGRREVAEALLSAFLRPRRAAVAAA